MWKKTIITVEFPLIGIILVGAWLSSTPIERFGIYLQRNNEPVITVRTSYGMSPISVGSSSQREDSKRSKRCM